MVDHSVQAFLKGHAGKRLLNAHAVTDTGYWEVFSEPGDGAPACLGIFKGQLAHVLEVAVQLKGFWSWGSGGSVEHILVHEVHAQSGAQLESNRLRQQQVKQQIAELEAELGRLGYLGSSTL